MPWPQGEALIHIGSVEFIGPSAPAAEKAVLDPLLKDLAKKLGCGRKASSRVGTAPMLRAAE